MGRFNILPLDIITKILTRLPAEGVLECKLVCKSWLQLIRCSSFSQLHLTQLNSSDEDSCKLTFIVIDEESLLEKKDCIYTEYDENSDWSPFPTQIKMDLDIPKSISFIGSCNGLICLGSWRQVAGPEFLLYGPCTLCNPITREYVHLPPPKRHNLWTGFGYGLSTNEYKVVRIYASGGVLNFGIVQVYTLGSGTGWRNAGTMQINMDYVEQGSGKFANGALHWVNKEGTIIHAFHLADENFSEFTSPVRPDDPDINMKLGVLCDFLSVTWNYYNGCGYKIWLLKKNNENNNGLSWSEEFYFDDIPWEIRQSENLWPSGHTKSGRILWHTRFIYYSYDPKTSSAKRALSLGICTEAIPHKNTLVSLKELGEEDTKTMKTGERTSSSKDTRNYGKLRKLNDI